MYNKKVWKPSFKKGGTDIEILIIWIFLTGVCIWGCRKVRNKCAKWILGIVSGFLLLGICLFALTFYELNYAIRTVDTKTSPDSQYEIILQSVGSPIFFSNADGRLVLKQGRETIAKYNFTLADDGGSIRPEIWSVVWNDNHVQIIVCGEEQSDQEYLLYFDGYTTSWEH